MAKLTDENARTDLLNRLKRAEGQLRGIQRMLEAGEAPHGGLALQIAFGAGLVYAAQVVVLP